MSSLSAEQNTIRIIHDEHGNLASIIRGMQYFVRTIDQGGPVPDLKVFRAMLFYIDQFPDRIHHPKEDRHLFARLQRRTDQVDDTLEELSHQHEQGAELVRRLGQALARYEFEGSAAFPAFRALVSEYAAFYFSHMRLEEEVILPAAARFLQPEDWKEIEAVFASNREPLTGVELKGNFDKLFSLIVNITPAPMGVGAALN
ncbi:MAG: hemerythrin domain-containing protein [Burkholderiaceae bacterium]